jgi:hypothetical protein
MNVAIWLPVPLTLGEDIYADVSAFEEPMAAV